MSLGINTKQDPNEIGQHRYYSFRVKDKAADGKWRYFKDFDGEYEMVLSDSKVVFAVPLGVAVHMRYWINQLYPTAIQIIEQRRMHTSYRNYRGINPDGSVDWDNSSEQSVIKRPTPYDIYKEFN